MAPLLVVVILSVLVLPIAGVQVGNNTSRWLTEANYLSKAKGFGPAIQGSLTVRRPLLPLMIAAAYKIGGKSVHSAVVLVRIFFAFELVLIYLIGRVFYNAAAGCGWVGYMLLHKSSLRGLFASAYAASTYRIIGAGRPLSEWTYLFTSGLGKSLSGYYTIFLLKITPLSVFLVAGWSFILVRGLIKLLEVMGVVGIPIAPAAQLEVVKRYAASSRQPLKRRLTAFAKRVAYGTI